MKFFRRRAMGNDVQPLDSVHGEVIIVDASGLRELKRTTSLTAYIRRLWSARDFLWQDAKSRAFRSTRDFYFWRLWLVADPILNAAMYGLLFGGLLRTSHGVDNYLGFIIVGITFFGFLSRLFRGGGGLLKAMGPFIKAFDFPRTAIVLGRSLQMLLDSLLPLVVCAVVAIFSAGLSNLSWHFVLIIPLYLLLHLFGTGLMLITARLTTFIPDVRALIDVVNRAWFFGSGIFFSIERFATNPTLATLMMNNPAYIFIESFRGAMLYNSAPSLAQWGLMAMWSLGTFLVGFIYFYDGEERYDRFV